MTTDTVILTIHSPENRRVDGVSRSSLVNIILAEFGLVGRVFVSQDPFKARLPITADKERVRYIADLFLGTHRIDYDIE